MKIGRPAGRSSSLKRRDSVTRPKSNKLEQLWPDKEPVGAAPDPIGFRFGVHKVAEQRTRCTRRELRTRPRR